jgi:hypothetical protein
LGDGKGLGRFTIEVYPGSSISEEEPGQPRKVSKKPRRSRAKNKRNKSTLSYA